MVKSMNLHYEERGAGPVLINLHGWPAEHGQMMTMMEPLLATVQLAPDLPRPSRHGQIARAQVAG